MLCFPKRGIIMENYIIMCRSITYAQRGQRLLERSGISAYINKAPQNVSLEGCSYGIRIMRKNLFKALEILHKGGVKTGRVFKLELDGSFREIEI